MAIQTDMLSEAGRRDNRDQQNDEEKSPPRSVSVNIPLNCFNWFWTTRGAGTPHNIATSKMPEMRLYESIMFF